MTFPEIWRYRMSTREGFLIALIISVAFLSVSGCSGKAAIHDRADLSAFETHENNNAAYHHDDGFQDDDSDFWYR